MVDPQYSHQAACVSGLTYAPNVGFDQWLDVILQEAEVCNSGLTFKPL